MKTMINYNFGNNLYYAIVNKSDISVSKSSNRLETDQARVVLERLLNIFDISLDEILINDNAKPYFKSSNIYFNYSHSKNYIACVISNYEVGIDIEEKTRVISDDISSKYIIKDITTNQAIMFLPAEAIFAELNAYHNDLIEYAYKKRVWITSPTTLMSTLTVIQMIIKNIERDKYTSIIHEELNKLGIEFGRYRERWDKLSRSIQTVSNDVENIHKTTEKITKRFDSINNVKIEDDDTPLIEE